MKVGIISMQRICNYGSYLQAFGLKKMIESLGHEVEFIDYKAGKPLMKSRNDKIKYVVTTAKKKAIRSVSGSKTMSALLPKDYWFTTRSYRNYKNRYWPVLGLTKKKQYSTKVDTVVIGSDEVFNCLQSNPDVGFSTDLFGGRANADKIITYAASFGNTTYDALVNEGVADTVKNLVSRYNAVSVRDKNSLDIMQRMLPGKTISENLDPVLMFEFGKRKRKPVDISNYIVVYAYRGRLSEEEIKAIKAFAKVENKKIVCIGGYHSFADKYVQTSPFHVLDYFENADYVITDTFHGTIFSLINHTKFGVLVRNGHGKVYGNSEKLNDLLSRLECESRIVPSLDKLSETVKADLDFDSIDRIIKNEHIRTMDYLRTNL